ncbi:MAG TPA: hypothetical protein VJ023_07085 [Pyrinomonadaceae bacterium]|nr:hypothetical protein [Pyrinomonadaceae bacterium]
MSMLDCEQVQLANMAESAGEELPIPAEQVALHMAACENCRKQAEQLRDLDQMLASQVRRNQNVDLWPVIQHQIGVQPEAGASWKPFAAMALLLAGYKLFEMSAAQEPALLFNLVPLILMTGLFVLIKENPFRINSELMLEK